MLLPVFALLLATFGAAAAEPPVLIGLDAEFGLKNSTSAQAIEKGARIAIDEINRAGGVLGGRELQLVTTDNRSVPARARDNLEELAARPNLIAVLCGRFSPLVLETLDIVHAAKLVELDPWAAADGIVESSHSPNYVFRLSLRDRLAMPAMLAHARSHGASRVGLLLPNTSWGRSNHAAAENAAKALGPAIVAVEWYNWGDRSFIDKYEHLRTAGAQAILLVANDLEAAPLVREVAALPPDRRLPIAAHWGITGGTLFEQTADALQKVDLAVVQTFSFTRLPPARLAAFKASHDRLYPPADPVRLPSPVGIAHAYDLVHLLARAIDKAGTADRAQVRDALERLRDYDGLVKRLPEPFTPSRHDALDQDDVFMAAYGPDGVLRPLGKGGR
ncbi:MAG: ABC transporter substrate-binding protein [Actinomycetota bacterium]